VGGSLAHADPGADFPAVMLVLGAELRVTGPRGQRTIPVDDFFLDILTTALAPNEVLTEIRIPIPREGTGGAYAKFRHPASGYALIGVAALVTREGGAGAIREARVALTGLGTRAARARATEQALTGKNADDALIADAAARVTEGVEPRADAQGSADYKKHLASVYARRAISIALERA
jgi:carbon-monoxide dehydrogenase medium subunit